MILSFKKFDNLLLYLSLKVGVNFMNSQHLRLKWHFEKLDKYGPWTPVSTCFPSFLCELEYVGDWRTQMKIFDVSCKI